RRRIAGTPLLGSAGARRYRICLVHADCRPIGGLGATVVNREAVWCSRPGMITAMDAVDHPERDQAWDASARSETETQRLDRNWLSLLQELRVVQTGVQLLTGFLLTLPFQQRFDTLNTTMRVVYLITVGCSVAATVLLESPVAMHRLLFRRHRIEYVVATAHR